MRYHLIMGNQAYSSWSLRGWLLLKAFGIDFDQEVVPLYVPGYEQFLADNYPANTVPVLQVFDGSDKITIWDSLGSKSLCRDAFKLHGLAFDHADECAPGLPEYQAGR
jgi:glutathione S-transferase